MIDQFFLASGKPTCTTLNGLKNCSSLLLGFLVLAFGCKTEISESFEITYRSSFENDLDDWSPHGTDLQLGNGTIEWSITRSQDRATEGSSSAKYFLNNLNDAGKIWLERSFAVASSSMYQVKVTYDFASRDFGSVNLFTIITGVYVDPPRSRDALQASYQGNTGNGSPNDVGYQWLPKQYEFTVSSGSSSTLYVVIGVWGTWQGPRTYYVDNVRVTLTEQ